LAVVIAFAICCPVPAADTVGGANILETAMLSSVQVAPAGPAAQARPRQPRYKSSITIYDVATKSTKVLYTADTVWEAPNWSIDGKFLLANSGGKIYKLAVNGTGQVTPEKLDIDATLSCNNDHGHRGTARCWPSPPRLPRCGNRGSTSPTPMARTRA